MPPGQTRKVTYAELAREVSKIANIMKSMGVKKGQDFSLETQSLIYNLYYCPVTYYADD